MRSIAGGIGRRLEGLILEAVRILGALGSMAAGVVLTALFFGVATIWGWAVYGIE